MTAHRRQRMEKLMNYYVVNYLNFVNMLRAEYNSNARALKADDREDEAVLFRIRTNICDIFYKMAKATDNKVEAMKITDEKEQIQKFNEDYLAWFTKIPENWKASLVQAQKFNDAITVKTEEVKLETADILKNKFIEIAGEAILQTK
jgi:hypothetical protein